jgi:hypothetical protein
MQYLQSPVDKFRKNAMTWSGRDFPSQGEDADFGGIKATKTGSIYRNALLST